MGHYVVTGGASGIGAHLVGDLVDRGHEVLVWDVREPEARDGVRFEAVDLTDAAAISGACARIARPVDVFVHCAGVIASTTITSDNLAAMMDLAYRVHCLSFVTAVQGLLPRFADRAAIVAISSAATDLVYPGSLAYGASKAALDRVVKQLAVELGDRGIRINSIAPGSIATPMTRHLWEQPDYAAERLRHIPLGHQAQPSAIAEAVAYLASDASSYVTGQTLWVDGGVRHAMFQPGVRSFKTS